MERGGGHVIAWMALAAAVEVSATDGFDELVCVEQTSPPRGASRIAASQLGWAHDLRRDIHRNSPRAPEAEQVLAWLPVDVDVPAGRAVAGGIQVARHPSGEGWIAVIEARAWSRPSIVAPNLTLVVDVSQSMDTVFTRKLPPLQDEAGPPFRPVTRLEVARAALHELADRLPGDAQVSVIAMDGTQAVEVLAPHRVENGDALRQAIDALRVSMIKPRDPLTVRVLEDTSARTFATCHDNKVVMLTDHVADLTQRKAVEDVRRWARSDVEVWSFGVGLLREFDQDLALLKQATGGAAWVLNAPSDAGEVWRHILDPGGVVARDVVLRLDVPPGSSWRELPGGQEASGPVIHALGSMVSNQEWARVLAIAPPPGASPDAVRLSVVDTIAGEVVVPAGPIPRDPTDVASVADLSPTARSRAVAALWFDGVDVPVASLAAQLPHGGPGAELRAWMLAAPAAPEASVPAP